MNVTINYVEKYLNGANASDVKAQFAGDTDGISHQNLLSSWKIRIKHEEVPVLYPPMEPSIGENNQPSLIIGAVIVQAP